MTTQTTNTAYHPTGYDPKRTVNQNNMIPLLVLLLEMLVGSVAGRSVDDIHRVVKSVILSHNHVRYLQ